MSCSANTAKQFETISCSLSLAYFLNATVTVNTGDGNRQTFSLTCKLFDF